ncbi:MAG: ImmA/IrrE family metallo-endopeptidase [Desulfobacterales bacterium]|jgi:Zn-dependent peptidase ImmA (M78 family)|nr:ImmA/IrrE family metallo-endopeptidase [Desulfobacterales bacterium]
MKNDISYKLIEAERLAAGLIDEFGICSPEHIRIRDIAFIKGAVVVEKKVPGAAASIVKLGNKATIRIPGGDPPERQRFSIAHELGHLLMNHLTSIKKVCNNEDMFSWYQSSQETQANFFASELILPTKLVELRCDVGTVNFDPIRAIAKDFRASLTATAIKFVRHCPEQCAVIFSAHNQIKWFYKSPTWWRFIKRENNLDQRTLAYDFFAGEQMEPDPQEVDADAWVESRGLEEVVEHSIASPTFGFVLTVLWVKPE